MKTEIKTSRLTKALLETARDMKDAGVLGKANYEKITMRHLDLKDKNKLVEPLTGGAPPAGAGGFLQRGKNIRMIREQAHLSQMENTLLSESALQKDWLSAEEDEAWKDL